MENTKCSECGAYHGHSIDCEQKTPKEWRASALQYYKAWLKLEMRERHRVKVLDERIKRIKDAATLWQGKYAILKLENNALRKKLLK